MSFSDDCVESEAAVAEPTAEELRDAAIRAFTNAVEQPHGGRVGEALDAVARWLRVELRE
jgi:hypothetical protein